MQKWLLIALSLLLNTVIAQDSIFKSRNIFMGAGVNPSVCLGDLKDRFGTFNSIELKGFLKNTKNYTFGASYKVLFGQNAKLDSSIFKDMSFGNYMVDINGNPANIRMHLRGYELTANIGKIWKLKHDAQKLKGFHTQLGLGMLQTRIKMQFDSDKVPQLEDDYVYGYDKLHNGIVLTQNIEYFNYNTQSISYYAGIQFGQGFTYNRRNWEYSLNYADTKRKNDFYAGFHVGIIFPFKLQTKGANNYFE